MAVMVVLVLMIAGGSIIQNKHAEERAWCNEHAVDPVDARDRAILDREGEGSFGVEVKSQRQSGADCPHARRR